jgi:amino acid transporter
MTQGTWASASYHALTGPFAQVAMVAGFGWLAWILYVDAIVSPGGTGLIYVTATSRVSFGLSRNGYFPAIFEKTTKRGIPWFGLIIAFAIGCVCFLPFPSWQSLVGLITSASVLMYAGAPLAMAALRRRMPNADRPYRLPGAVVLAPLSFIIANLIIMWSGWTTDWKLGIAVIIGYIVLTLNQLLNLNPVKPPLNWKSAQWLPVYLIGMGLIVFLSDFGPLKHPWFPLGWDFVAVGVFSLIIFYWARQVALPTERIQAVIDETVAPEEEASGLKLS